MWMDKGSLMVKGKSGVDAWLKVPSGQIGSA